VGDERFDLPKGKENLAAYLKDRFPDEAKGIDGYLDALSNMMGSLREVGKVKGVGSAVKSVGSAATVLRWGTRTGQDLIDHYISDPVLKAVFSGQSGDHGLPPSEVSAFVHAGVTHHYFNGGYYPRGGAFAIPRAFVRALKRAGGEIRLNTSVSRILVEDGRAVGVELDDGSQVRSDYVISNADPGVTFGKLIGRDRLSGRLQKKLDNVTYSGSCLSLFFAVDMDLSEAGLDSGNYWFYDNEHVDQIYQDGLESKFLESVGPPEGMFLTVTTLKDPSKMHSGHHTCESFAFVGYKAFERWADEKSGAHTDDYEAMKEELAERMFQGLERRVPGISKHVVFWSLGTPITNKHFVNATNGNLYGTAKTRSQVGPGAFPVQTEIDGLLMCGASTLSHGVSGATFSGLAAAKKILNCRTSDLLTMDGPELRIFPSEHPDEWPENLQERIERGQTTA
jgi:all-trans-retinol 13,14-reductase